MLLRCMWLLCSLISQLVSSAEEPFEIKRNNLNKFRDRFKVPSTQGKPPDNFCSKFGAEKYKNITTDCWCPLERATFGYYNRVWTCLGNSNLRTREACSVQINSEKTHREDALHVVDNAKPKVYPVNLTDDKSCQVDTTASKYQKCGEEWQTLSPSGNLTRFSLLGDTNKGYKLKVEISTNVTQYLNGSLIRLVFNCGAYCNQPCLLIKMRGTIKCPVKPLLPSQTPSTVIRPTCTACCSSADSLESRTRISSAIPTSYTPLNTRSIMPTTAHTSPMPSSSVQISVKPGDKNKRGKDGRDAAFISVTAGAVAAGLFVIVVAIIIVFVIRRRKNKRANTSVDNILVTEARHESTKNVPMLPIQNDYASLVHNDNMTQKSTTIDSSVTNPIYECGPDSSVEFTFTEMESIQSPSSPLAHKIAERKNNTYSDCSGEVPPVVQPEDGPKRVPLYDVLEDPNMVSSDWDESHRLDEAEMNLLYCAPNEMGPSYAGKKGPSKDDDPVYDNTEEVSQGLSPNEGTEINPVYFTAQEVMNTLPDALDDQRGYQELHRPQQEPEMYQTLTRPKNT